MALGPQAPGHGPTAAARYQLHLLQPRRGGARKQLVVTRLDRVIQYAAASQSITIVSGIPGRPVKPGDDDLLQWKDSKTARPSAPAARSGAARRRRSRNR